MKIHLTKKRLYTDMILGALWVVLGASYFIFDEALSWLGYGFMIVGSFNLFQFFYNLQHQYLIIKNGRIQKNILYSFINRIEIDEIEEIKKIKGNYILKSKKTNLKINPDLIEKESLENLIEFLKKLEVPSENPFLAN